VKIKDANPTPIRLMKTEAAIIGIHDDDQRPASIRDDSEPLRAKEIAELEREFPIGHGKNLHAMIPGVGHISPVVDNHCGGRVMKLGGRRTELSPRFASEDDAMTKSVNCD
jgi:hypothetical protein